MVFVFSFSFQDERGVPTSEHTKRRAKDKAGVRCAGESFRKVMWDTHDDAHVHVVHTSRASPRPSSLANTPLVVLVVIGTIAVTNSGFGGAALVSFFWVAPFSSSVLNARILLLVGVCDGSHSRRLARVALCRLLVPRVFDARSREVCVCVRARCAPPVRVWCAEEMAVGEYKVFSWPRCFCFFQNRK